MDTSKRMFIPPACSPPHAMMLRLHYTQTSAPSWLHGHAQRHSQSLSSASPARHGHERVHESSSLSTADAGSGPACCLRWGACALHLEDRHAVLSSCHVPRAGPLVGHVLPKRGRAACSKIELGRLRWQAACAGSQVPLQLLCIAAERACGPCLHRRAFSSICSVAPCVPCNAMESLSMLRPA